MPLRRRSHEIPLKEGQKEYAEILKYKKYYDYLLKAQTFYIAKWAWEKYKVI